MRRRDTKRYREGGGGRRKMSDKQREGGGGTGISFYFLNSKFDRLFCFKIKIHWKKKKKVKLPFISSSKVNFYNNVIFD